MSFEIVEQSVPIKELRQIIKTAKLSVGEAKVLSKLVEKDSQEIRRLSVDYIPKEYASKTVGLTAYTKILETDCSVVEAIRYSANLQGKTKEWDDLVKNQKYYYSKEVVKARDNHWKQKEIAKNKAFDRSDLTGSKTLNQLLIRLKRNKDMSDGIKKIKNENIVLKQTLNRLEYLEAADINRQISHNRLLEIMDIDDIEDKERCRLMFIGGATKKAMADVLKISESTVKRWCRAFKHTSIPNDIPK